MGLLWFDDKLWILVDVATRARLNALKQSFPQYLKRKHDRFVYLLNKLVLQTQSIFFLKKASMMILSMEIDNPEDDLRYL